MKFSNSVSKSNPLPKVSSLGPVSKLPKGPSRFGNELFVGSVPSTESLPFPSVDDVGTSLNLSFLTSSICSSVFSARVAGGSEMLLVAGSSIVGVGRDRSGSPMRSEAADAGLVVGRSDPTS